MLKIYTKKTELKHTNAIFFIQEEGDLEQIDFLLLEDVKIKKIKEILKDKKNTVLSFFLGEKHIETVTLLFSFETDFQKNITFLGEKFRLLDGKITLFVNKSENLELLTNCLLLSTYKFHKYKTLQKNENDFSIFLTHKSHEEKVIKRIKTIENIFLCRDLGETPSSDLTPESFAAIVKKTKFKHTKVKILSFKDIQKKGLGLLEAVGKGSIHKPRMVILERIVNKKLPSYGIVGKGMTFDTGGIQVKPGDNMYDMKGDMAGAATVFSMMKELDDKDVQVNMIACLCLAENHISGESYKPSDIITSYSGKTVEVIHTDAEGRLVLADGISYLSKHYPLEHIMTVATLTGAVVVALGHRFAGVMGNDEVFIQKLLDYSKGNLEKYVQLPFDDYFIEKTKSDIADLKNLTKGIQAGSTMGAAFLANFVDEKTLYTHIDIAGVAINSFEPYGYMCKGMTGFGVDSLSQIFLSLKD